MVNRILHFVEHGTRGSGDGDRVRRSDGEKVREIEKVCACVCVCVCMG